MVVKDALCGHRWMEVKGCCDMLQEHCDGCLLEQDVHKGN